MASLRVLVPLVVSLVTCLVVSSPALGQSTERRRMDEVRARVEQIRDQVDAQRGRVRDDEAALAAADQRIADVVAAVDVAQGAVDRQQRRVDAVRGEAEDAVRAAAASRRSAEQRARELWIRGRPSHAVALLGASRSDALDRAEYGERLAREDRRAAEAEEAAAARAEQQAELLADEEAELAAVLVEQQALLTDVEALREERSIRLAASRAGLEQLSDEREYLEADEHRLAELVAASDAVAQRAAQAAVQQRAAQDAAQQRVAPAVPVTPSHSGSTSGTWSWPVDGRITSPYGYRWGRLHAGIDIAAPSGTPLVAARAGTVTFAGTAGGYGLLTLVDHGDGIVTAYAHQSQLVARVGQPVARGQQIGAVGSTGNSTGPHVHFEVRVGGATRNPRGYLP